MPVVELRCEYQWMQIFYRLTTFMKNIRDYKEYFPLLTIQCH